MHFLLALQKIETCSGVQSKSSQASLTLRIPFPEVRNWKGTESGLVSKKNCFVFVHSSVISFSFSFCFSVLLLPHKIYLSQNIYLIFILRSSSSLLNTIHVAYIFLFYHVFFLGFIFLQIFSSVLLFIKILCMTKSMIGSDMPSALGIV